MKVKKILKTARDDNLGKLSKNMFFVVVWFGVIIF